MIGLLRWINWIDILALILLIRITYISSRIGVGRQILPLFLLAFILTVCLHNYRIIAWFFVDQYEFKAEPSLFFSYFLMALLFFIFYHFVSRLGGFCFFPGEIVPGGIEKIGGIILGFVRSIFIIGLILIGLLLMPVKVIGDSVKRSNLGVFYINTSVKIYCVIANTVLKSKKSYNEKLSDLFSKR